MLGRVGPNMLRHSDQSIAALASLDVDPAWKWRLMTAVADYSTGFAIREAREREAARTGQSELLQPYLRQLADSGDFPHLAPMLDAAPWRTTTSNAACAGCWTASPSSSASAVLRMIAGWVLKRTRYG
jgi:hypothetical protein